MYRQKMDFSSHAYTYVDSWFYKIQSHLVCMFRSVESLFRSLFILVFYDVFLQW